MVSVRLKLIKQRKRASRSLNLVQWLTKLVIMAKKSQRKPRLITRMCRRTPRNQLRKARKSKKKSTKRPRKLMMI